MKEIVVGSNEAGQRLDKLLGKVLNLAPQSFIYKMLRKKNIKLNQKKAEGKEILSAGDCVQIYLSDETYEKFHEEKSQKYKASLAESQIIYLDDNIMILNKPAGVLSQKAKSEDDSINEQMIQFLLERGRVTTEQLSSFTPSVCNRLDRNTSGIVLAGISLKGSQELSRMLKERSLEKYYLALVSGKMTQPRKVTAYLKKNEKTNQVSVSDEPIQGGSLIETHYQPLQWNEKYTLLEVKLVTGKSHQIRAHLAYLGHPIVGDAKYGNREVNREFREKFKIQNQFLHAYRVVFPILEGELKNISCTEWKAPLPKKYNRSLIELWNLDYNQENNLQKQEQ